MAISSLASRTNDLGSQARRAVHRASDTATMTGQLDDYSTTAKTPNIQNETTCQFSKQTQEGIALTRARVSRVTLHDTSIHLPDRAKFIRQEEQLDFDQKRAGH